MNESVIVDKMATSEKHATGVAASVIFSLTRSVWSPESNLFGFFWPLRGSSPLVTLIFSVHQCYASINAYRWFCMMVILLATINIELSVTFNITLLYIASEMCYIVLTDVNWLSKLNSNDYYVTLCRLFILFLCTLVLDSWSQLFLFVERKRQFSCWQWKKIRQDGRSVQKLCNANWWIETVCRGRGQCVFRCYADLQ